MPRARRRSGAKAKKQPTRPCTYELGYVRQDLYACKKCTAEAGGQRSGFCRGCRETCHADHPDEVFELYTKRAFRCDCGNSRAKNKCLLYPAKQDLNVGNEKSYGHNFDARYCRCDTPYDESKAMAQCAMCEDWFHEVCYRTDSARRGVDSDSVYDLDYEFTCMDCVKTLPILADYYEIWNAWEAGTAPLPLNSAKKDACTRPTSANVVMKPGTIDYLWQPSWRLRLCRCRDCRAIYDRARASYIIDRADFVGAPPDDDSVLLNATNDAEIVKDVLEGRVKSSPDPLDTIRVPRKPLPGSIVKDGGKVSPQEIRNIRARIQRFLEASIKSNGGSLNPESIRAYLCDLKEDLLKSIPGQQLAS
eukprot:GFKZ01009679.1.p1 GENE.GFKZ01009679.1~~GFKZ01009679.1.p1  ORF type:complete len:400 (+),score=32.87 GFKZ01009679.1:117-1202(+)